MPNEKKPRTCVWVDATCYVEGEGYRVSVVTEDEPGHHPTGDWPFTGTVGQVRPWFWGPTLEDAKKACAYHNEKMGLSARDVLEIVASSIRAQNAEGSK